MISKRSETNLQHFEKLLNGSDMGDYFAAEFLALQRAMDTLKRSNGRPIRYAEWFKDAVEFVDNLEAGIGCKYRDLSPSLYALEKRGLIKVTGDQEKLFSAEDDVWVQITPKGYLANKNEWWTEEDYLDLEFNK